jgi:chemotaxis protein methyltransferase CheR
VRNTVAPFPNAVNDTALFAELAQFAMRQIGLRIPDDAHERILGMLRERSTHLGYRLLTEYQTFLAGTQAAEEWEELARIFTCGETFFFRDRGQIDLLRLHLLPQLIARHGTDKTLRLWSAGCASGEEVYSLAMLVDMLLPNRDGWNILILGTDIDSKAIARARRARYGAWSFRMVPEEMQQRYFRLEGKLWVLDENIRRMVTLRVSNLVVDPFPDSASGLHGMDLILCRNVFIYFNSAAVYSVAAKFAATLLEGAYLLTAHTELIGHPVRELRSRLFAEGVVYQRVSCQNIAAGPVAPPSRELVAAPLRTSPQVPPAKAPAAPINALVFKAAQAHADQGEFDLAELACRNALVINPLTAAPYFLLAQLAQIKGDFNLAKDCLTKAIYLDSRFVAAYLELAALCEHAGDLSRAQTLRSTALGLARSMPENELIEQYEMTAGALAQWLSQLASESKEGTSKANPNQLSA